VPGPGRRQCTAYLRPGPGGLPLALRLNDMLGRIPGGAMELALLTCCSQLLDGDLHELGYANGFRLAGEPDFYPVG
jgi:hypothetical protein